MTQPQPTPPPIAFDLLLHRFGMTKEQVYTLALFEALAEQYQHQPRQITADSWEIDSRSEPGTVRRVQRSGNRLLCDCPAAHGDQEAGRAPRICTHSAAVHMQICHDLGKPLLVRPMPPWVLRRDPSPEARAALALIEYRKPKAQTEPAPALVEVQP